MPSVTSVVKRQGEGGPRRPHLLPRAKRCRTVILPCRKADYCNSLRTLCCIWLAWASAEMPVWLRI